MKPVKREDDHLLMVHHFYISIGDLETVTTPPWVALDENTEHRHVENKIRKAGEDH